MVFYRSFLLFEKGQAAARFAEGIFAGAVHFYYDRPHTCEDTGILYEYSH